MRSRMNFLPSAVASVFADSRCNQYKARRRLASAARKGSVSTERHPWRVSRAFTHLIEQFWFARGRQSHYPVRHDIDFVLPTLKLKPD
jgi:hypothetical protein